MMAGLQQVQRSSASRPLAGSFSPAPSIVHDVLRSPGQPLDAQTRAFMEPRFGHEFSQVRIHADAGTAQVLRSMEAEAFKPEYEAPERVPRVHEACAPPVNTNQSAHPLPFADTIQRSFGRHDVTHIRAHMGSAAAAEAWAIGAEAFARGSDVTFSRTPSVHTAAHEAAHVIQQRAGVEVTGGIGKEGDAYERHADAVANRVIRGQSSEDLLDAPPGPGPFRSEADQGSGPKNLIAASRAPVVQLRRIPPNIRVLLTSASGGNAANFDADAEGALRLIDRALTELPHADRVAVFRRRRGALTEDQYNALPRRKRRILTVEAILALFPAMQLGDPNQLDAGPRPATADAANITRVVTHANTIFSDIASGAQDSNLTEVFGSGSVATAKAKYALARTQMNTLHGLNKIITDRGSGFSGEVFEGGLSGRNQISVSPSTIDDPDAKESRVTLLHESMHAGNSDVGDNGYIHVQPDRFRARLEADKLRNAAHFEVVPRRILGLPHAYMGQTFIPAGTTVAGVTAPLPTAAEEGARDASEQLRKAWNLGLNLHRRYVQLFRTPTDWTVPQPALGGIRFDNSIPFWSKVQKLTIHEKTVIDPASPEEAKHPVSQIDVALSEGLTRKLALAGQLLGPLDTQANILAFEAAQSNAAERSAAFPGGAHTNATAERDFLLKLAVRSPIVAPMTGSVARDLRVVQQQGDPSLLLWTDILKPRNPASFPD